MYELPKFYSDKYIYGIDFSDGRDYTVLSKLSKKTGKITFFEITEPKNVSEEERQKIINGVIEEFKILG